MPDLIASRKAIFAAVILHSKPVKMQFKIKNVGIITSADVKLDGLTVIGGENDTGKSTVGKLLFAIIKGISRYEQDLRENKEERLVDMLDMLYFDLRNHKNFRDILDPWSFRRELRPFLDINTSIKQGKLFDIEDSSLDDLIRDKVDKIENSKLDDSQKSKSITRLNEIKHLLSPIQEDRNETIKRALKRAFNSEFYAELSPRHLPKAASKITLSKDDSSIFEIDISDDNIKKFDLEDSLFYEDVTFVDSPILLQMFDVIRNADTLLELESDDKQSRLRSAGRPKVALHLKDLMSKIEGARYLVGRTESGDSSMNKMIETISKLIGGYFAFDREIRDFVFSKKHNGGSKQIQVRASNTASGIKSFGMIQLLVQAGFVDRRSLLIIDEPETHLHPKWQVEYARLLIALVKAEIPVLLTSHSPYMIQALKVFSEKEGIADLTNFYLAEREPKIPGTVIIDVTKDLNRLFQKLAEPLHQLAWE